MQPIVLDGARCVLVFALLALPSTAAAQPRAAMIPGNIHGMSAERAAQLPGRLMELFRIRNASDPPKFDSGPFREGEVIARFPLEVTDDQVLQLAAEVGAERVERLSALGLFLLLGESATQATHRIMDGLWESDQVAMVSPNYYDPRGLASVVHPDDPHYQSGTQWYLDAGSDIDLDLPEAWGISEGAADVVVAVMDTGIATAHPEFSGGRLWTNPGEIPGNFNDDDGNGYDDDIHGWNTTFPGGNADIEDLPASVGHGTWVSSILMANANNAHQVAGFDHAAKLLTVRVIDSTGLQQARILAGFDYLLASTDYFDILNMSWSTGDSPLYAADLQNLDDAGVLLIAGSGNENQPNVPIRHPAGHPAVITVGGTDASDARWVDAPNLGSNWGTGLDFMAPSDDIYTASFSDPFTAGAAHVGPETSFATPMVSGIASLGYSVRPGMTKEEFLFALRQSAVDLGSSGYDTEYGWGRVNAFEALQILYEMLFCDGFESGDVSLWDASSP